jgi:hypothetical protein
MEAPKYGLYELDMGKVVVRAGGSARINVQPKKTFRPCRLVVLPESVGSFTVTEVTMHKVTLWQCPLPTSEFGNQGVLLTAAFLSQPATPSMFITVSVTNTSPDDRVFRAVVSGPQQEDARGETA